MTKNDRKSYNSPTINKPENSKIAGLEFDGGTAAIYRGALLTGRNALWMKQ